MTFYGVGFVVQCCDRVCLSGVLAMEALHRQVLPFLLRRMKEDVLQDLPLKIIQDYYCNLSSLQVHTLALAVSSRLLLFTQIFLVIFLSLFVGSVV